MLRIALTLLAVWTLCGVSFIAGAAWAAHKLWNQDAP